MRTLLTSIAAAALLAVGLSLGAARAAEPVEVPSGDVKLRAMLYRPAGPGPFPAVVALHTCDGLADGEGIDERYKEWGEHLAKSGFAVLFPDSFGSRGVSAQCGQRQHPVRASRTRINDARAARQWLQAQPWVIPDRVSLLGWSHGATTALWTIRRRGSAGQSKTADFRSAVALYPNCQRAGTLANRWSPARAAAAPARRLSSIPVRCTTSTARTSRRRNAAGSPIPQVRMAASTSAPTRRRAPTRSSACRSGFRADELN
jgi:dienelactone hydrolase